MSGGEAAHPAVPPHPAAPPRSASPRRGKVLSFAAAALWLAVWQLASWAVAQPLLLPGPVEVARALVALATEPAFWGKVGFSAARITGGCALAYAAALLLAAASRASGAFEVLVRPPLVAIKSTPVACFVVLLLMWLGTSNVSMAAVSLMALPGVYFPALEGLTGVDAGRLEMLRVHGVRGARRLLALTWPEALPFLLAASKTVLGMSWKSGVAAELIGMPLGSIGERIYQAKLLLDTPSLFAWTLVVIALATVWERACLWLLRASGPAAIRLAVRLRPRGEAELGFGVAARSGFCPGGTGGAVEAGDDLPGGVPEPGADASRGAIVADGLVLPHGAAGGWPVLLSVAPGGRLCLMGPSGVGKTTLLRVLEGLETPISSERLEVPARISVEFQDARLIEGASAFANCALVAAPDRSDAEIRRLLERAIPGIDPCVSVSELSGGQRRRVELVRALLAPGDCIILDEPFAGLDDGAHAAVCSLVRSELRGRSLVIATHDARDAGLLGAAVYHVGT